MNGFSSVLIGENALLIQCGNILLEAGNSIAAVATETAAVRDWAMERSIPIVDSGTGFADRLQEFEFDWLFSIANLRLVPDALCARARRGAINFHDGPLPERAGLNTPSWTILDGRETHGVTWHEMTLGVDQGDIYASRVISVAPDETALTLNTKCFEAGIASFTQLVQDISAGTLVRRKQDLSRRTYFPRHKRPSAAGILRFNESAASLSRLVRALSFGSGYANPLTSPKVATSQGIYSVSSLAVLEEPQTPRPGEILSVQDDGVVVATADFPVLITAARTTSHGTVQLQSHVRAGERLPVPSDDEIAMLDASLARTIPHESRHRELILQAEDISLDGVAPADPNVHAEIRSLQLNIGQERPAEQRIALALAYLVRLSGRSRVNVAWSSHRYRELSDAHPGFFGRSAPLRIDVEPTTTSAVFIETAIEIVADAERRLSYACDLIERYPDLETPRLSVGICRASRAALAEPLEGCAITFAFADDSDLLIYDSRRVPEAKASELAERFAILASGFALDEPAARLPLMREAERKKLLHDWNRSKRDYDSNVCIQDLIERQALLTPDATAVSHAGQSITYRELERRATHITAALTARGAVPDSIVGLHMPRGIDLVVGAYAILKAGAAYLPLDPAFPSDRLALMVSDSATPLILTSRLLEPLRDMGTASALVIEELLDAAVEQPAPAAVCQPNNLAYVIYTSGSTGRPKGVMVEHRNVINFFAGMDDRIQRSHTGRDVWLAVTSLSFDISVLEIFWTLSRGFKVVIHASELDSAKAAVAPACASDAGAMDFSLFYWGNDDGVGPAKYKTLIEGACFADQNGFQAVWTPERHFHAFGGPYPNPAVTGAAVAAVTKNLSIRAGSCVLPLHHPARVAEEWSVVDNLSNGRVGLAFAAGWMPEDFVLRPENAPPNNKAALFRDIETVRRLWRGEKVEFDLDGRKIGVVTQPRPMSSELPVWVTTAGNPDTYRDAARCGANVLTHLLGQSIDELADKIRIYRQSLAETGRNPADYKVTVMLHTLVGDDREKVRDLARGPMKDYLRSAAALIKQYAWAFPAFKKPAGMSNPMDVDLRSVSSEEMDAILEFAFLRYFDDSGLFGTVGDAVARATQLRSIGVDEIACLIDFGAPAEQVLEALKPLAEVVRLSRMPAAAGSIEGGLAQDIRREGVTHLQCTPSMMEMFLSAPEHRRVLADVKHLFIGGEALKRTLLDDLRSATSATVMNMYGPTETTIWSTTTPISPSDIEVSLGSPIANTQLYVLDHALEPVPVGMQGELYIGGDGVTRGYLNRGDLTHERFLPNPFADGRIYRTGDLVRYDASGRLEFIGRADNQVKVRGNRIELGEIEARIATEHGVRDAVVMVREDRPGDKRIVAYIRAGAPVDIDRLKARLATEMPEYMIPAHFVTVKNFPLTPNAKVDRSRLPKPQDEEIVLNQYAPPTTGIEQTIAALFQRVLGASRVGLHDNFFTLGGHSLLALQLHREIKKDIAPQITITDIYRFPTVSGLTGFLGGDGDQDRELSKAAERAAVRRSALDNRRAAFARATNVV